MVLGRMIHLLLEDHLVVLLNDKLLEHQLGGDVEASGLCQQVGHGVDGEEGGEQGEQEHQDDAEVLPQEPHPPASTAQH